MEQATTGKAPPPIGIPSGVILNMRGASGIGATVVPPPPGSAQAGTVVGSPGPPGKGVVGPRMISISPQMLANSTRPGQPPEASDDDETDSVLNQCDENISDNNIDHDDNHHELVLKTTNATPEPSCSLSPPASITGVSVSSSDLQQQLQPQHGDKYNACGDADNQCKPDGELLLEDDDDSLDREVNLVKASSSLADKRVEGNGKCTDLSLSSPSCLGDSPNPVTSERSVSRSSIAPPSTNSHPPLSLSSSPSTLPTPPPNISPTLSPGDGDLNEEKSPMHFNSGDSVPVNEPMNCDGDNGTTNLGSCSSNVSNTSTSRNGDNNVDVREHENVVSETVGSNENANTGNDKSATSDKTLVTDDSELNGAQFESENKCNYDKVETHVPTPTESEYTTTTTAGPGENSPATKSDNLGALQSCSRNSSSPKSNCSNVDDKDTSTSQSCVQSNGDGEKSVIVSLAEHYDSGNNSRDNCNQQTLVTVTSASDDSSSVVTNIKCVTSTTTTTETERKPAGEVEEPPPLIHEGSTLEDMGQNENRNTTNQEVEEEEERPVTEEADHNDTTVDDVNLDMFSDSGVEDAGSNGAVVQQVGRATSTQISEGGQRTAEQGVTVRRNSFPGNGIREEAGEDRPKLVDLNLADFIFMDDEIEVLEEGPPPSQTISPSATTGMVNSGSWNSQTPASRPLASLEHPYSPPKIMNEIFSATRSSPASTLSMANSVGSADSFSPQPTWNKNKIPSAMDVVQQQQRLQQQQQSPPSCAFQLHGVQPQSNLQSRMPPTGQNPYSVSPTGTRQTLHSSMYPSSNSQITNLSSPYPSSSSTARANVSNTIPSSSEYKANYSQQQYQHSVQQQQQSRCFTTDPQLQAQFLQYTKNYPFGPQDNTKEPAKLISPPTAAAVTGASALPTRGQYPHATHMQQAQQHLQQDHSKVQSVRPAVIIPQHQQQQQHSMNAMRQPAGVGQQAHLQQRQYSPAVVSQQQPPQQHQHYHPNSPFQSQYRSNVITNANGCDNSKNSNSSSKLGYGMPQQQQQHHHQVNMHDRSSTYNVGPGQPQAPMSSSSMGSMRPPMGGTGHHYYPGHTSQQSHHHSSASATIAQQTHVRHAQQYPATMPKELPSCSYAARIPANQQQPSVHNPNYPGTATASATQQQHSSSASYPGYTGGGYSGTSATAGAPTRMPYSHQQTQHQAYPSQGRPAVPSSSQQVPSSSKVPSMNTPPAGWNPPLLQGARAQLLQVLRPGAFPNQNLAGRGVGTSSMQSPQQSATRMPYPSSSSSSHHQQQQQQQQQLYRAQPSTSVTMSQLHQMQQRQTASVISPRYPGVPQQQHHGMPGGSSDNLPKQPTAIPTSTLTSPQMLRNPQYLAHHQFRPAGASSDHGTTSSAAGAYNQSSSSSVIRPNVVYTAASQYSPAGTTASSSSTNISSNVNRPFFGNASSSSVGSSNVSAYPSNQASVIRAPPGSSGNSASACTINRSSASSCIVIERAGHHHPTTNPSTSSSSTGGGGGYSSGGNSGELTIQSFLSHPSAPFMCPSPTSSSTPNTNSPSSHHGAERSGYHFGSSEHWGGGSFHPARGAGDHDNEDETMASLSSCQYSADGAMRRYNAPITLQSLQALSGLPPGANHLLLKTENGQFQLVSVRPHTPTAAAPGTPVVPSTVAASPTSMSIAQQLPSNSPHAPPLPQPPTPHQGPPPPGGVPGSLVPPSPNSSSLITTTTIPPHLSAQQGRIITSSSSNHIVTSWSSSNNNSLVNNNSTSSSPLPVISSSAAPHPAPHLGPPPTSSGPPPIHAPPPNSSPAVPSSVIMHPPPPAPHPSPSASNSQLLSTANNNSISSSSTSSSSTYSSAAQSAVASVIDMYNQQRAASTAQQQQQQHGSVMGPPGGSRLQAPPTANSIPNNLPPGATVIRTASGVSLPPPPPVIVSSSSNAAAAAAVAAVANSVISSSTNPTNSMGPTSSSGGGGFRHPQPTSVQSAASAVPNNNASNNAPQQGGSLGMSFGSASPSNSIMSVPPPHPNHGQLQHSHHLQNPPFNSQVHSSSQQQSAYLTSPYASNLNASSSNNSTTANTVSQMSNETAKTKCKNFLSFLLELSAKQNQTVARNVKNLIQGLIDGKVNEENFADRLQKEVNSQPQPCLVGFLKKSLPHLRHSLAVNELKIEGIKPPPLATLVPPAPVSALVPQTPPTPPETTTTTTTSRKKPSKQTPTVRPTTPTVPASPVRTATPPVNSASPSSTPHTPSASASSSGTPTPPTTSPSPSSTKTSKPKSSSSKSKSSSNSSAGASASGPGGTPSSKSSIPSTSKAGKDKEKKDRQFSSSGYGGDDDINDVAAMGGVNLAEESQRILGSTEYVGTQIRSCRDETLLSASPIAAKFKAIAARYGLDESPSSEVSALLSHAVEERLKTMIEQLSVIAEHRMDVIKMDERYEITQDVKGQLRFLEELDKIEKKRHDEQEREMLIRAAKSRSKSEDPEQAKLKAKAKEMQRVALEEMRQRDANLTALQAIGPRKKPKLDLAGGSHGSAVPNPLGATGASSSLGRTQMPLRPRLKRVNLRDLLFLLEHDKETMRSPFLYKNLLLKQ